MQKTEDVKSYNSWNKDLSWSQKKFIELVWPAIKAFIGSGDFKSVELFSDKGFAKELDTLAGIDAWQIINNIGMRGIACRVQIIKDGHKPFNTFSIRLSRKTGSKTEYEKLEKAYITQTDKGWLAPSLTCQAYITQNKESLISCAVIKTKDLINFIAKNPDKCLTKKSDNIFVAVKWDVLKADRLNIIILDKNE